MLLAAEHGSLEISFTTVLGKGGNWVSRDPGDSLENLTRCPVNGLVSLPSLVLQVALLGHADDNDKEHGNERSNRAIRANGRYRLHDCVEGVEPDDDLLVLDEKYDGKERPNAVACRIDLVRGRYPLLSARRVPLVSILPITVLLLLSIQGWYDRETVLDS